MSMDMKVCTHCKQVALYFANGRYFCKKHKQQAVHQREQYMNRHYEPVSDLLEQETRACAIAIRTFDRRTSTKQGRRASMPVGLAQSGLRRRTAGR